LAQLVENSRDFSRWFLRMSWFFSSGNAVLAL
jgi:hypothetical protein